MDVLNQTLTVVLDQIVNLAIILLEFIGVGIIIFTCFKGFYLYLRGYEHTRIYLGNGLLMGLEFKLGSEILRTVIVREWKEILIVGSIIALRAALNFLIHWELKQEKKEAAEKTA